MTAQHDFRPPPAPATASVRTVVLRDGTRVPCAVAGPRGHRSVPLVLIHGIGDSWRSYARILELAPPDVTTVAVTLRGHGDADRPEGGYALDQLAGDIVDVLDHLGMPMAAVVGHSLGASVAQQLAVDHPSRVAALVLAGALAEPSSNAAIQELVVFADTLDDPPDPLSIAELQHGTVEQHVASEFMEMVVSESLKVPSGVWRAAATGLVGPTPRQHEITAPTTLVWGDRDAFVPRSDQEHLLDAIADCRLLVYAGAGHAVHWEQPQRFVDDLVAVVRRATRADGGSS